MNVNVFQDMNHNSNQGDDDKGLSGALIELARYDEEGLDGRIVASGITGEDGFLTFSRLPAGNYRVRCYLPKGYGYSEKSRKTNTLKDNIMERYSAPQQEGPLFLLEEEAVWDVGIGATQSAQFSGRAWIDENGNGLMEEGEKPLTGLTVEMAGIRNGLIYRTKTDESGNYTFTQLRQGSYRLQVSVPEPYVLPRYVRKAQYQDMNAKEGRTAISAEYVLSGATQAMSGQNIGVYEPARVQGFCFLDRNGDGRPGEGEKGIRDVEIRLWNLEEDRMAAETVSGADGTYLISGLRPGSYRVEARLPDVKYAYTAVSGAEDGNRFEQGSGRRSTLPELQLSMGGDERINAGMVPAGN